MCALWLSNMRAPLHRDNYDLQYNAETFFIDLVSHLGKRAFL
jgi:hypothetical protein